MFGSNWEGANLQWGETTSYPNILFILFSLIFIERLLSDFLDSFSIFRFNKWLEEFQNVYGE